MTSAAFLLVGVSCTVLLDHGTEQCQNDDDCAKFGNRPSCSPDHLCTSSGLAPKMCFFGTPSKPDEFLNQCSRGWLLADPTAPQSELGECLAYPSSNLMPSAPLVDPTPMPAKTTPAGPPPTTLCSRVAPSGGQVLYMTGSSNFPPLLEKLAPAISAYAPGLTAVFKTTTSCGGVRSAYLDQGVLASGGAPKFYADHVIHDPASPTATDAYAQYFNPATGKLASCLLGAAGATVDVGESEIYPDTCGIVKDPVNVAETPGPILAMLFAVPYKATQRAISSEAAREVFGAGLKLDSWTIPEHLYVRGSGTATLQMVARQIGVMPTKFWGADQGTADAMATNLALVLDPVEANQTIGILGADFYDRNRAGLKALAFQAVDQDCAYTPDSNSNSLTLPKDKLNVRDGHYPMWGPIHFFSVEIGSETSTVAASFVSLFGGAMIPIKMLDAIIDAGFVPACAMRVDRVGQELPAGLVSKAPAYACGCHFDSYVNPMASFIPPGCTACSDTAPCANSMQECHYGFCEAASL